LDILSLAGLVASSLNVVRWRREGTWNRLVAHAQTMPDAAGETMWEVGMDSTIAGGFASTSLDVPLFRRWPVRWGFLKLCGGALTGLAGLILLGAAGCGSGEDQQDDQQNADQQDDQQDTVRDNDRRLQRC
jgi:hypothetical protein